MEIIWTIIKKWHRLPQKLLQLDVLVEQNPVVDAKEKQKIPMDAVINTKGQLL